MVPPFKFLSMDEFKPLGCGEKLTYLSDAMEELERLKVPQPQWAFICANDRWTYRSADGRVGGPFVSYGWASADAADHGFQPLSQYWTVTLDGRTTHYRPCRATLNLKAGEKPPD